MICLAPRRKRPTRSLGAESQSVTENENRFLLFVGRAKKKGCFDNEVECLVIDLVADEVPHRCALREQVRVDSDLARRLQQHLEDEDLAQYLQSEVERERE